MAWIESHQGLPKHPKTKKLMRRLKVSAPVIIGHLHMLWWWAMDFAQDGEITHYDEFDIADACEWNEDAAEFYSALIEAGFVDCIGEQRFIHDWYDYAGKLIEIRKKDAERKRNSRGKTKESVRNPEDVRRTSQGHTEESGGQRKESIRDLDLNLDLNLNNTTTADEDLSKIDREYARIHKCTGLKSKDWPLVTSLLKQKIPADLIISVMEERYAKKIDEGGEVNSFSFYTNAIKEASVGRVAKISDRMSLFVDIEKGAM